MKAIATRTTALKMTILCYCMSLYTYVKSVVYKSHIINLLLSVKTLVWYFPVMTSLSVNKKLVITALPSLPFFSGFISKKIKTNQFINSNTITTIFNVVHAVFRLFQYANNYLLRQEVCTFWYIYISLFCYIYIYIYISLLYIAILM